MTKKILLLFFFLTATYFFAQEKSVSNLTATPNPFSTSSVISFDSNEEQGVFLVVKNVLGKTVFRKGYYTQKGKKEITFQRNDLAPGMYIYAIQSRKNIISKRFVIK